MNNSKTLRLVFPQWQGGMNPNYYFGSHILQLILPKGRCEEIEVPVSENFDEKVKRDNLMNEDILLKQLKMAYDILEIKNPDKVITIGGDCSVSQSSFDYLHGKYKDKKIGVLWIDAHPDITTPKDFEHEHAMVMGNLLGDGAPEFAKIVKHPFKYEQLMLAGLIRNQCLPYESKYLEEKKIKFSTPEDLEKDSSKITDWIKEMGFEYILIHLDVDVMNPTQFRSLLCNEPNLPPVDYAIGALDVKKVVRIATDVQKCCKIVGFTIAEYMPWDIINIQKEFCKIDIFNE